VTALSNGDFVVTWESYDGVDDTSGSGIKARIFDAGGNEVVSEFLVNEETNSNQFAPSVAALPNGGFVVTWYSYDGVDDTSQTGIKARVFDADGTPLGPVEADEDQVALIRTARLLGNDIDPDGDVLSVASVAAMSTKGAVLTLNGDGTISFDPTGSAVLQALGDGETTTDTFTYEVSDGNGGTDTATATITVNGANDAPTVDQGIANTTVSKGSALGLAVPGNAFDDADGDVLTLTAALTGGGALPSWLSFDGTIFTGTPGNGDIGAIGIRVTADDGNGGVTDTTFTLTVVQALTNGPDLFSGTAGNDVINGLDGNDTLYGLAGNDTINGLGGNDLLFGSNGNDRINGGAGRDTMNGGAGNDLFTVDNAGDRAVGGAGVDKVNASVSHVLANGTENLGLTGSADINGTGNAVANILNGNGGNNKLIGNAGNDQLFGNNGNDTLIGGAGRDTMYGGAGNDLFSVDNAGDRAVGGGGIDKVNASVSHVLANGTENLGLTGSADINGTGNAVANILNGNGGNNKLIGNAGNDQLFGNNGNDTLIGGAGRDTMYGGAGNDLLFGDGGSDRILGGGGSDTAAYNGGIGRYQITELSGGRIKVVDTKGTFGTDILSDVEFLKFGTTVVKVADALNTEPPRTARADDGGMVEAPAPLGEIPDMLFNGQFSHLDDLLV